MRMVFLFIFLFMSQLSSAQIDNLIFDFDGVKVWEIAKQKYLDYLNPDIVYSWEYWAENTNKNVNVCVDVSIDFSKGSYNVTSNLISNVYIKKGEKVPLGSVDITNIYANGHITLRIQSDLTAKCEPNWLNDVTWVLKDLSYGIGDMIQSLIIYNDSSYMIDIKYCYTQSNNKVTGGIYNGINPGENKIFILTKYSSLNGSPVVRKSVERNKVHFDLCN